MVQVPPVMENSGVVIPVSTMVKFAGVTLLLKSNSTGTFVAVA